MQSTTSIPLHEARGTSFRTSFASLQLVSSESHQTDNNRRTLAFTAPRIGSKEEWCGCRRLGASNVCGSKLSRKYTNHLKKQLV